MHARRVDATEIGRLGGLASGAARRESAQRVRDRLVDIRAREGVDRVRKQLRELKREQEESRHWLTRDLMDRRRRFIEAARAELRHTLRDERAELRRLRRERKQLETFLCRTEAGGEESTATASRRCADPRSAAKRQY
jgi:hypothetical protein